jgi:hypothetical protein
MRVFLLATLAVFHSAMAQEEVIELPEVEPLPSVVEDFEASDEPLLRGRFGFRPELALTFLAAPEAAYGVRLGGSLLHNWWTVPVRGKVRWTGATSLGASGLVGGVRGWEFSLSTEVGPWLGPVRIGVGPQLLSDRVVSPVRDDLLIAALLIGPRATVSVDAGPLLFWGGVAPQWAVAGTRGDWKPGLTELGVHGGVSARFNVMKVIRAQLGVRSRVRLTEIGTLVDVGLRLHATFGGFR